MITTHNYFLHPGKYLDKLGGYTLPSALKDAALADAHAPAVFDGKRYHSWHEWWHEASAIASSLQNLGISKGDVVALHLPNCWEYLTLHVAIAMSGAVTFPLHMAYGEHELHVLLERASASTLVLPSISPQSNRIHIEKRLLSSLPALQHLIVVGTEEQNDALNIETLIRQGNGTSPLLVDMQPDDPFVLLASSGTTSLRPKICIHSHDGLLSNAAAVRASGKARADDTVISASPFTHLFGLLSIHLSILSQCQQALLPSWKTQDFLDLAHRSAATVAFAVPAQLRDVCLYLDTHPDTSRINLREVRTGGAKVSSLLVDDVRRVLGASVIVQWGMSEVGAGTFTRPDDPPEAASTGIGSPVTGAEVRIIDTSNENNQDASSLP